MTKKKQALPFDKRGGTVVICRYLLNSEAYAALRPQAKVLIQLMHEHWQNSKPVSYGVREAAKKIPCDDKTVMKCFDALQELGFIECVGQSKFNSGKAGSHARDWRLTWLPYKSEKPTNEWDK